jgi:hypothetical protein
MTPIAGQAIAASMCDHYHGGWTLDYELATTLLVEYLENGTIVAAEVTSRGPVVVTDSRWDAAAWNGIPLSS